MNVCIRGTRPDYCLSKHCCCCKNKPNWAVVRYDEHRAKLEFSSWQYFLQYTYSRRHKGVNLRKLEDWQREMEEEEGVEKLLPLLTEMTIREGKRRETKKKPWCVCVCLDAALLYWRRRRRECCLMLLRISQSSIMAWKTGQVCQKRVSLSFCVQLLWRPGALLF